MGLNEDEKSFFARLDRQFAKILEMLNARSLQQSLQSPPPPPQPSPIEFPKFDEWEPERWILEVEQYFVLNSIPDTERVSMASDYLCSEAIVWYRRQLQECGELNWRQFSKFLCDYFGSRRLYFGLRFRKKLDQMRALTKLSETRLRVASFADFRLQTPINHASEVVLCKEEETTKEFNVSSHNTTLNTLPGLIPNLEQVSSNEKQEKRKEQELCFQCDEVYDRGVVHVSLEDFPLQVNQNMNASLPSFSESCLIRAKASIARQQGLTIQRPNIDRQCGLALKQPPDFPVSLIDGSYLLTLAMKKVIHAYIGLLATFTNLLMTGFFREWLIPWKTTTFTEWWIPWKGKTTWPKEDTMTHFPDFKLEDKSSFKAAGMMGLQLEDKPCFRDAGMIQLEDKLCFREVRDSRVISRRKVSSSEARIMASSTQFAPSRRMGICDPMHQMSMWEGAYGSHISPNTGMCMISKGEEDRLLHEKSDQYSSEEPLMPPLDSQAAISISDKVMRRLAQNREAARKSRMRKKVYVQQLETSRIRLAQLELELDRARQQGMCIGGAAANVGAIIPGIAAFQMKYAHWVEEKRKKTLGLRTALQTPANDIELHLLVDRFLRHYQELFRMKAEAAKADVFYVMSGVWKTSVERFFLWIGGFRPSELVNILITAIEPLTDQQLLNVCNLRHSCQQAEDALKQGIDKLQQNLVQSVATDPLGMATFTSQMASSVEMLEALESFVIQADHLRQQTLQRMSFILTHRQAARGLLAFGEYFQRLRTISSLWAARTRGS